MREIVYMLSLDKQNKFFPHPTYIGYSSAGEGRVGTHLNNLKIWWKNLMDEKEFSLGQRKNYEKVLNYKKGDVLPYDILYIAMVMHQIISFDLYWNVDVKILDSREYKKSQFTPRTQEVMNADGSFFTERHFLNQNNRQSEFFGFNNLNSKINEAKRAVKFGNLNEIEYQKIIKNDEKELKNINFNNKSALVSLTHGDGRLWNEFFEEFRKKRDIFKKKRAEKIKVTKKEEPKVIKEEVKFNKNIYRLHKNGKIYLKKQHFMSDEKKKEINNEWNIATLNWLKEKKDRTEAEQKRYLKLILKLGKEI